MFHQSASLLLYISLNNDFSHIICENSTAFLLFYNGFFMNRSTDSFDFKELTKALIPIDGLSIRDT